MLGPKIIALALFAMFLRGCDGKVVVDRVPAGNVTPANGVIYALPNTVVRTQIKLDRVTRTSAPYAVFAGIFAPEGDTVCKTFDCSAPEDNENYSVQQGATFSTFGEPDPSQVFLVKFTGKGAIDQTLSMTWNEAGLLSAASASVTNRTGDVILSGLKLATGLGVKAFAAGAGKVDTTAAQKQRFCMSDSVASDTWVLEELQKTKTSSGSVEFVLDDDVREYLIENYCGLKVDDDKKHRGGIPDPDSVVIMKNPDGTTHPLQQINQQTGAVGTYTYRDLLGDAIREYNAQIVPLLKTRTQILGGSTNVIDPDKQLAITNAELNKRLTALFLGSKKTLTWEGVLDLRNLMKDELVNGIHVPRPRINTPIAILRVDPQKGVCLGEADYSPESKHIPEGADKFVVLKDPDCKNAPAVSLKLEYYPDVNNQLFGKITDDETKRERSFRYRIPAQVKATLVNNSGEKIYGAGAFSVAQFGTVISLPATRHSKTLSYELGLVENTGGLKTFKLGTTGGLDAATVDALGGIGGTLLDARKQNDELNRLTRQDQLLKLQDEICTIQQKYGLPCTVKPQ